MATQTLKLEIIKPLNAEWKVLGEVLRELQYNTWKIANKGIQLSWDYQQFDFSYKKKYGEYFKKEHGKLPDGKSNIIPTLNEICKEFNEMMPGNMKDALGKMILDKWNNDTIDILKGHKSIPNFRRTIPIELHNKQLIKKVNGDIVPCIETERINNRTNYYIDINLLSKKYAKEKYGRSDGWFKVVVAAKNPNQMIILDRLISKEYKLSMSRISYNKQKRKWFLLLAYSFTPVKKELNKNRIMGVDIGVAVPAMLAISDHDFYHRSVGDAKEVRDFELQMKDRTRRLQKSLATSGESRRGHGKNTFLKPLTKLKGKIANFKETKNHQWSSSIIKEAIKNDCGVIQMEKLTGISENASKKKENVFLKNWTFFSLQEKIKYKAENIGIKVIFIEPKHTSSRCSKCGHIHRSIDKDSWRPTQDKFICQACSYQANADVNAAKNISTNDIDKIIEKELSKV